MNLLSIPRRILALVFIIIFLTLLYILGVSVSRESVIQEKMDKFRFIYVYNNVRISGSELDLIHLSPEKDSLLECEIICSERKDCVAVNYYLASKKEKKLAQCQLFSRFEASSISNDLCCSLAVKRSEKKEIDLLNRIIPKEQHAH